MLNDIAFDLDGTLVDTETILNEICLNRFGATIIHSTGYQIRTEPPISNKDLWKGFNAMFKAYKRTKPYEGAVELLTKLWEMTHDPVTIITARPRHAATETYSLVARYFKMPVRLILCNSSDRKLSYLNSFSFFVDDRRKTALQLLAAGKTVFIPKRQYNCFPKVYHKNYYGQFQFIEGVKDLIPRIGRLVKKEN